jgi:MFS superfamily sulfate permease-like transporter
MIVNGSLSKTAVNGGAGAHSQVSGLVVAALTIVTLLFLTGLFEELPEATLGAVVIAALVELVDFRSIARYYRLYTGRLGRIYGLAARPDFLAAVAALLGVLFFDTLPGLFIGIAVSIALLVYRASRSHVAVLGLVPGTTDQYGDVERHPENRTAPGIVILRPEGGMFFANADHIRTTIRERAAATDVRTVILDLGTVSDIDLTASEMLLQVADDLARTGRTLSIAHDIGQVRDTLGLERDHPIPVYPTVAAAVAAAGAAAGHSAPTETNG